MAQLIVQATEQVLTKEDHLNSFPTFDCLIAASVTACHIFTAVYSNLILGFVLCQSTCRSR